MSDKTDAELIAEARAYFPWRHPTVSPFDPKSEGGPCAGCIAHTFADRLEARNAEVAELTELILDLFAQGCGLPSGKYNHSFISTYEWAQKWLIDRGLIKPEQCEYKS